MGSRLFFKFWSGSTISIADQFKQFFGGSHLIFETRHANFPFLIYTSINLNYLNGYYFGILIYQCTIAVFRIMSAPQIMIDIFNLRSNKKRVLMQKIAFQVAFT